MRGAGAGAAADAAPLTIAVSTNMSALNGDAYHDHGNCADCPYRCFTIVLGILPTPFRSHVMLPHIPTVASKFSW